MLTLAMTLAMARIRFPIILKSNWKQFEFCGRKLIHQQKIKHLWIELGIKRRIEGLCCNHRILFNWKRFCLKIKKRLSDFLLTNLKSVTIQNITLFYISLKIQEKINLNVIFVILIFRSEFEFNGLAIWSVTLLILCR